MKRTIFNTARLVCNTFFNRLSQAAFFAFVVLLVCTGTVQAQNADWTNTTNTNSFWHIGSNWNTGTVPTGSARFNATGSYQVRFNSTTESVSPSVGSIVFFGFQDVTFFGTDLFPSDFEVTNFISGAGDELTITGINLTCQGFNGTFSQLTIGETSIAATSVTANTMFANNLLINNGAVVDAVTYSLRNLEVTNSATVNGGDLFMDLGNSRVAGVGSTISISGDLEIPNTLLVVEDSGAITCGSLTLTGNLILNLESGGSVLVNDETFMNANFPEFPTQLNVDDGTELNTNQLQIADYSSLTIEGSVDVASNFELLGDSIVTLSANGVLDAATTTIAIPDTLFVNDGRLEFGVTDYDSFSRINYDNTSQLVGSVLLTGYTDASTLPALQSIDAGFNNVKIRNEGILNGSGVLDALLINEMDGEVRLTTTANLRTRSSVENHGEINLLGGLLEGEDDFYQYGFLFGHGVLIAQFFDNTGVMAMSGPADILGDFCNNGGLVISTGTGTTTFFDDVNAEPGCEFRTSGNSATVMLGGFTGTGNFSGTGSVYFEGDLQPGHSPGRIAFEGNVSLGNSVVTEIEIGGGTIGQFDQLVVDGDFSAGGMLVVELIDNFELMPGASFPIVEVGGTAFSQFAGLDEGDIVLADGDNDLKISYVGGDGNDVILFVESSNVLIGDVNLDGVVNLLDVQPFVNLISTSVFQAEADINEDGTVNLLDVDPFVNLLAGN